jgi:mono/diheme cytochrome c family protein
MDARIVLTAGWLSMLMAGAALAGVTSEPDPKHGKELAERLCSNCHLVEAGQEHANVDIPTFHEIANMTGQTEGAIIAHIILPKHPMPVIPITKSELSDLAAYIMTLRKPQ